MDELFEALTLIQTGKIDSFPVVLIGRTYWAPLVELLHRMVMEHTIDAGDLKLLLVTDDLDAVVAHIERNSVQRFGLKSLWKAKYDILDTTASTLSIREPANVIMTIREENPWIKVIDGLIQVIPLAEMFTGFFLHPAYSVARPDGTVVMRIRKQAAFWESRFSVEKEAALDELDEQRVLLSLIMLVLLERNRG